MFPFRDAEEWINFLESKGHLIRNDTEVELRGDISAISSRACRPDIPAILHQNIKGYPGWRILCNTFVGRQRQAWALGIDVENFLSDIAKKMDMRVPPMEVSTAPCKEIKLFGDEVDLTKIPIPFTGEHEGTPNITAGVSNVRDMDTGWQNIAVRRFGLKGKRKLSEFINVTQQDYAIWGKYRIQKKKMPIAITLCPDPITYLVSQIKVPVGVCEYELWGAFTGMPLEVVRCETSELLVPASAQVVIEGEIDPMDRELDGPFPELYGYYTTIAAVAKVDVKCITMRKNPIFYYINCGWPPTEGHEIGGMMTSISEYSHLTKLFPGILDVNPHRWNQISIIKVDGRISKNWPQFALQIATEVKNHGFAVKGVIVVDQDVEDIFDLYQVMDAMVGKFQAGKDFFILPRMPGTTLDPSEPWGGRWGWTDFFVMDCTDKPTPWDEGYKRGKGLPPSDAMEKVIKNWERYGFKNK